jgi:hypothetical protein
MVTVCAWCQRYLGMKDPAENTSVSHGICASCIARQKWPDSPTLVVSRNRAELAPILQELLRGTPEIRIIVDRRSGERRGRGEGEAPPDRRKGDDPRRGGLLLLS